MTGHSRTDRIDLAKIELNFEGFRRLAQDTSLSVHERIGFPDSYRAGYEPLILADIRRKVPALDRKGQLIIDIGPGCANLPRMICDLCAANDNRLLLVDSAEMLDQLPEAPGVIKVVGSFPDNFDAVCKAAGGLADGLICYSVLHYMFVDTNPFLAIDRSIQLLASGGAALFGDVPNHSKRRRFFSSPAGVRFHQEFTRSDTLPPAPGTGAEAGKIDDAVLVGLLLRAQQAGCDAYLVPQSPDLPMANRRDDLLIRKP